MVTGPKVEETTTHEPDKAGFTPASESSDDDEVDPILKEEFYRQLDESEGFDVDITIPQISFSTNICEDNDRYSSYRDMLDMYARVGLHWYNFHKGSNFQFSTIYKYNSWNIFDYYITLEAMDPADKSSFTFQARVIRAASVNDEHLRILSEGCRIKPQIPGTGDEIHPWDYPDDIDDNYNGNLPKWYSDDALMMPSSDDKHHQFYQVQDSDIRENDWLKMYAEIALYSLHESDKWLLQSWLPVEINKVVVQTYEDVKSSKEKLKAGNAIFYIAFKNLNAPSNGLPQDHRAIVRRTTDGVPGHVCLEFKCWLQDAEEDDVAQGSGVAGESAEVTDDTTSADYYFDSDSHFGIHEEMFKDVVRAKTYQNVIYKNKFLIKDKIVLDVGAGTGILSLFCAKAGAAHVYAVECSQMADMAKEIVKANGFSDVITVLKGKIEEIELPTPKVDVIISEWMGYFLLFENMLDSVLYARDKWLVDGGVVLPDRASLHLTAIEDSEYKEDKIDIWNSVYGFDMSCIKKKAMMEPLIDTVDQNQIVTDSRLLKTMDISKMSSGDASFTAPFKLVAQRNDYIHALVAYFDVSFTMCHKLLGFSTGPKSRATHWKQTVMYLEDVLTICEGETITGSMSVSYNKKNPRDIDIKLNYSLDGQHSKIERTQHYKMRWKFSQKKQNFNSTAETEKIHVAPFGSESQQQRSKTKKSHQFSLIPSTLVLFSVAATLICRFRRR